MSLVAIIIVSILVSLSLILAYMMSIVKEDLESYDRKMEEHWQPIQREEYINSIDDLYL